MELPWGLENVTKIVKVRHKVKFCSQLGISHVTYTRRFEIIVSWDKLLYSRLK